MIDYIYFCIPTYKSFSECEQAVESAMRGSLAPSKIVIIDNSGDGSGAKALDHLTKKYQNLHIWPQTYNTGVARAWNNFHKTLAEDFIIIANDDIQVHHNTLQLLYEAAKQNEHLPLIFGSGASGNAYSLFLLRKWGFEKIGPFDENFSPAYYEDNDYDYRRRLLGLGSITVVDATYDHVGSSTMKKYNDMEMQQHHHNFRRCTNYYDSKWGGLPGHERYTEEFNGDI